MKALGLNFETLSEICLSPDPIFTSYLPNEDQDKSKAPSLSSLSFQETNFYYFIEIPFKDTLLKIVKGTNQIKNKAAIEMGKHSLQIIRGVIPISSTNNQTLHGVKVVTDYILNRHLQNIFSIQSVIRRVVKDGKFKFWGRNGASEFGRFVQFSYKLKQEYSTVNGERVPYKKDRVYRILFNPKTRKLIRRSVMLPKGNTCERIELEERGFFDKFLEMQEIKKQDILKVYHKLGNTVYGTCTKSPSLYFHISNIELSTITRSIKKYWTDYKKTGIFEILGGKEVSLKSLRYFHRGGHFFCAHIEFWELIDEGGAKKKVKSSRIKVVRMSKGGEGQWVFGEVETVNGGLDLTDFYYPTPYDQGRVMRVQRGSFSQYYRILLKDNSAEFEPIGYTNSKRYFLDSIDKGKIKLVGFFDNYEVRKIEVDYKML